MNPVVAVELLFFAIFGQTTHEQFKVVNQQPSWTTNLFKVAFGIYMLVSVVVLINLLIAMMSDTYQRIQAQSDIEWKYGLSKLIRNMHRKVEFDRLGALAPETYEFQPEPGDLFCSQLFISKFVHPWLLVSPVEIYEKLFFSIFGQKETTDVALQLLKRPFWIIILFKISFAIYMLLTVIVLLPLLIAMMSDTYHHIQSQSDIEWKYGLSKLIRNFQKTKTAPTPLNLITTWASHLHTFLKDEWKAKKPLSKFRKFIRQHSFLGKKLFNNNKVIPQAERKRSVTFSPLISSDSVSSRSSHSVIETVKINDVVDWEIVQRKYRQQFSGELDKLPRK